MRDFDSNWLRSHEMKRAVKLPVAVSATDGSESDLHNQIIAELKLRRWYYCYSRTDKRTTQQLGIPDFVIASPNGVTFWIEAKRRNGKLTHEQTIAKHCLLALGHKYATVFSFKEFVEFIDL